MGDFPSTISNTRFMTADAWRGGEDLGAAADIGEAVELTTLPNGVRVATDRMTSLASASVGVFIGAGARHERAEENGVAHFLEHMAFKGTKTRSALRIAEEIEDVGGELNAYTSRETTAYYARVLAEHAGLAVELLADIVLNATLPDEEIEVERGVILQEIGQSHDTPDDVIFDWAQERAFPGQAVGRSILGPAENIRRFDRGALERFIETAYAPDKIVVAAAGLVDHAELVDLATRHFGDLKPRPPRALEPARYEGGEIRVEKDLEQAHMILGFEGPGYRDDGFHAAQVAATALCGGMSSRLFQEVREKRGLCYAIFASPSNYLETGWTSIYAGANGSDLRELIDVCADELRKGAAETTEEETARARAQIRAALLMGLESPAARCQRLARSLLAHDRVRGVPEVIEEIATVDAAAVRRALEAQLASTPTLALYGPVADAPSYDALCSRLNG